MESQDPTLPRTYKPKMTILWWTHRLSHIRFIMRELTSLTVAFFGVIAIFFLHAVATGPEAYARYLETLQSPLFIVLHMLALGGLLFHSITWFNLAPKAMVIKVGKKQIPGIVIVLGNYAGWVILSLAIILLYLNV